MVSLNEKLAQWQRSERNVKKTPFPLQFLKYVSKNLDEFKAIVGYNEIVVKIKKITKSKAPYTIISDLSNPVYYGNWFERIYEGRKIKGYKLTLKARSILRKLE